MNETSAAEIAEDRVLASLVEVLFGLTKRLDGVVGEILAELELTGPLADALWQLDPAAPPPTMRQLAAGLRCDPSTVTFLGDRLTERGLVEIRVDPTDRRRKHVTLTPQGARVRRQLLETLTARSPLSHLTLAEQRHLLDLLGRAVAAPAVDAGRPPGH